MNFLNTAAQVAQSLPQINAIAGDLANQLKRSKGVLTSFGATLGVGNGIVPQDSNALNEFLQRN